MKGRSISVLILLIVLVCAALTGCADIPPAAPPDGGGTSGENGGGNPPKDETLTLNRESVSVPIGGTFTLTADRTCEWTSDDAATATVEDGVVKGVAAGTTTITASAGTAKAETTVKVGGVMLAVGDSIFTTDFSPGMLDKVAGDLGYTLVRDTVSGSTVAPASGVGVVDRIDGGFYDALLDGRTPDVILIGRGTNDLFWSEQAGNPLKTGEANSTDKRETYGAIRYTLQYFQNKFPSAGIFWSNCIARTDVSGARITEFNANLSEICGEYGVKVIDLYNGTGIKGSALSKLTVDGIHPDAKGQAAYIITLEYALRCDGAKDIFTDELSWSRGYREGIAGREYSLSLTCGGEAKVYSTDETVATYDKSKEKAIVHRAGNALIVAEYGNAVAVSAVVGLD